MASIEVIVRSGIRALSGFSYVDPEERDTGKDWPDHNADEVILRCL